MVRQQGRGLLLVGPRLKAALALDGDEATAPQHALTLIRDALSAMAHGLDAQPLPQEPPARAMARLAVAQQGVGPRPHHDACRPPTLRHGGAVERRRRVEDAEMRHGRKRRSLLVEGYKRHGLRDLAACLRVAVGVTPAHAPEARGPDAIAMDLAAQPCTLRALPIDRASLASTLGQQRPAPLAIFCKAWPVPQGPFLPKTAVTLAWQQQVLQCPGGVTMPFKPGGLVQFPAATGAHCALRPRCPTSASGRSVSMHPDEAWLQEVRERQQTPQGRAKLRERGAVEHALAHIGSWQGRRARYRGVRKNVVDLRRCAVMHKRVRPPDRGNATGGMNT